MNSSSTVLIIVLLAGNKQSRNKNKSFYAISKSKFISVFFSFSQALLNEVDSNDVNKSDDERRRIVKILKNEKLIEEALKSNTAKANLARLIYAHLSPELN